MGDPRSKPKAAKAKDSRAPHILQAQAKMHTKVNEAAVRPQVAKKSGRGN